MARMSRNNKRKRRPFQFSLRTLMLAVLVVACIFSWLGVKLRRAADLEDAGFKITYVSEFPKGEGFELLNDTDVTDAGLAHLKGCPGLRAIFAVNTQITEEGVRELRKTAPNVGVRLEEPQGPPDSDNADERP